VQQGFARRVIDGTAIVGIHQREIPHFGALVRVGHAGYRELECRLRKAVDTSRKRNALRKRREVVRNGLPASVPSAPSTNRSSAASYAALTFTQLVIAFASRVAFCMYAWRRTRNASSARWLILPSGHAPTSVW
jgi:hypothetical protein